jgi:hypothetical protein
MDDKKEAIKLFLYSLFRLGNEHNLVCSCGGRISIKGCSNEHAEAICNFCGRKILIVYKAVQNFPHPYAKIKIEVEEIKTPITNKKV